MHATGIPTSSTFRGRLRFSANLRSNHFSRDNDFDAPVLLATFARAVVCHRIAQTEPLGSQHTRVEPLVLEVIANRIRTPFRKSLVELLAAGTVRVALNSKTKRGVVQHDAAEFSQGLSRFRSQIGLAGTKEHITHVDHETARRVGSRQNSVELLEQAGTQLLFLALGLFDSSPFLGFGCPRRLLLSSYFSVGFLLCRGSVCSSFGFCFCLCGSGSIFTLLRDAFLLLALHCQRACIL